MTNRIKIIDDQIQETRSTLCVGLDPILEYLPKEFSEAMDITGAMRYFLQEIVQLTASKTCCYKIQKAFFDLLPNGHSILKQMVGYIKQNHPKKTVLLDCKIGDVEHTLRAYCKNLLVNLDADGIVINPYMGREIFEMIGKYPSKLFLVLARTSNPGAAIIQDQVLANGHPLWQQILDLVIQSWRHTQNAVPVLSFSGGYKFNRHNYLPDSMPIFWAGYGLQQKNDISTIHSLKNRQGRGVVVNSSRGILYANYSNFSNWREAVEYNTAEAFRNLQI